MEVSIMKINKILAITVMALFLFSLVPAVFAQQERVDKRTDVMEERRSEAGNVLGEEVRVQEREEKRPLKASETQERKAEREQLREQLKTCKSGEESEDCDVARKNMKGDIKQRLLDHADKIADLINDLKTKVEKLDPADQEAILTELDTKLVELDAVKVKIDALTEDSSKQDVKDVTKELKDIWTDARKSIRLQATRMLAVGFERVLFKAEKLGERLDNTLARLSEQGFDTSVAADKLGEFDKYISESRAAYDEANVLLQEYRADPSKEGAVKAIQEKMKVAREKLQEAQHSLREIVKEVKKAEGGEKVLEEESQEAAKEAKEASDKAELEDVESEDSEDSEDAEVDQTEESEDSEETA